MGFFRPEYWSGQPFPPPGIFPTPGSNPGRPHCRWILYNLSHKGSPLKSILLGISYMPRSVLNTRRKCSHLIPLAVLRQVRALSAVRKSWVVPGTSLTWSHLHSRQISRPAPESLHHFTGDAAGIPLKFLEVLDIFLLCRAWGSGGGGDPSPREEDRGGESIPCQLALPMSSPNP